LQGGPSSHGPDKNDFLRAQWSNDLVKLATVVANYMSRSSFFYCIPRFEGEEVFGSTKRFANYPLSVDNDSHCPDHVNFFCPRVIVPIIQPNVGMQQPLCGSSACSPLVF